MSTFVLCKSPTPVYNYKRELEFIAFPETKFTCQQGGVSTMEYPSDTPLYIDPRLLHPTPSHTPERRKALPSSQTILTFMQSLLGTRYLWGGNWAQGIPKLLELFPNCSSDDDLCKGVDCSGLLYQATNGFTPRNTRELGHYGIPLLLNPASPSSIQEIVKPLDMLVWHGHVLFFLSPYETIESLSGHGVIQSSFPLRFSQIHPKLLSENKPFCLRRWHPDFT